ncbi:hypothetical protein B0T19DRAFT_479291 [Cercophora scortea]|uniref:Uncharacterized protein n=1 Tax=Cercophora scortea TaxID=314031 RepID=A0AAE0I8B2_9PEZI|nr:hypothetical protein B0T19DRAFT_479291 [Cercophora scortea]
MDQLKSVLGGSSSNNNQAQGTVNTQGQNPDMVDKFVNNTLHKQGVNTDPNTVEKVTDKARELFEGHSGKKVPSKFSN